MTKKAQHRDELERRVGEVLHYLWDPIGVSGDPYARDEYDSYVPRVVARLETEDGEAEIAEYLLKLESGSMGLVPNRERANAVAQILRAWKDTLDEKYG